MRGPVPVISTYEYGQVKLPPSLDTARIRERLETACLHMGLKVFETRDRRLFARGIVGVVDIGEVIVEILPKTRSSVAPSEGIAFLSELLKFTRHENPLGLTEASIGVGEGGLLEIVLAWAARTIAENLSEGLPRRYQDFEQASTAVRGRVELRHLVRQRPGRAFELTVRHAPLKDDNPVSRLIKWLVDQIGQRTSSLRTRALCLQLKQLLVHVTDTTPGKGDLDALTLSSMEDRWRPLMLLASIFVARGRPDPARGGRLPAIAILFTLHDLFERAVRRVLIDGLGEKWMLQRNTGHLLHPENGKLGTIGLRPDFRIGIKGTASTRIIGDAKWKRIFNETRHPRLNERDVYQLTTYMAALQAQAGFIISPLSDSEQAPFVRLAFRVLGLETCLEVFGVRLDLLIASSSEGVRLRHDLCCAITHL